MSNKSIMLSESKRIYHEVKFWSRWKLKTWKSQGKDSQHNTWDNNTIIWDINIIIWDINITTGDILYQLRNWRSKIGRGRYWYYYCGTVVSLHCCVTAVVLLYQNFSHDRTSLFTLSLYLAGLDFFENCTNLVLSR